MKVKALLLSMSAILLLGGCNSGGDNTSGNPTGTSTPTSTPEATTFDFEEKQYVSSLAPNYVFSYSKADKKMNGDYYSSLYELQINSKNTNASFSEVVSYVYKSTVATALVYQSSVMSVSKGNAKYYFFYLDAAGSKGSPCIGVENGSNIQFSTLSEYESSGLKALSQYEKGSYRSATAVKVTTRKGSKKNCYVEIMASSALSILYFYDTDSFQGGSQVYSLSFSKLYPNMVRCNVEGAKLSEYDLEAKSFKFELTSTDQEHIATVEEVTLTLKTFD